jgi:hypothetical protein
MYFVYFPWLPVEAALSILNINLFGYKTIFEKGLINTKRLPSMPNLKLSKNVCLEKIHSVVQ